LPQFNLEKTKDVSDIIYSFAKRRSTSREKDVKAIEHQTHMKKSRKNRGREFRSKINSKFGFKPSVVESDSDSSNSDFEISLPKKTRIGKFTF